MNCFGSHLFATPGTFAHVDYAADTQTRHVTSPGESRSDARTGATISAARSHHPRSGCQGILNVPFPVMGDTWGAFHSVSLPRARPVAPVAVDVSVHSALTDTERSRAPTTKEEDTSRAAAVVVYPPPLSGSWHTSATTMRARSHAHTLSTSAPSWMEQTPLIPSHRRSASSSPMHCPIGNYSPVDGVVPAPTLQAYSMHSQSHATAVEAHATLNERAELAAIAVADTPVAPRPISLSPLRRTETAMMTGMAVRLPPPPSRDTRATPTLTTTTTPTTNTTARPTLLPEPEALHSGAAVIPAPAPLRVTPLVAPQPLMPAVTRTRHAVADDAAGVAHEKKTTTTLSDERVAAEDVRGGRWTVTEELPSASSSVWMRTGRRSVLWRGGEAAPRVAEPTAKESRDGSTAGWAHAAGQPEAVLPPRAWAATAGSYPTMTTCEHADAHTAAAQERSSMHELSTRRAATATGKHTTASLVKNREGAVMHGDALAELVAEPQEPAAVPLPAHHVNPMASTAKDFLSNLFHREDKTPADLLHQSAAQSHAGAPRKSTAPSDYSVFFNSPLFDSVEDEGDANLDNLRGVLNTVFQGIKVEDIFPSVNVGSAASADNTTATRAGRYTEFTTSFVDNTARRFRGANGTGNAEHTYQTF